MKKLVITFLLLGFFSSSIAQIIPRYREGLYDGTYIHGVNNSGAPAQPGDISYREMPAGIALGAYTWWNYSNSIGEPSNSYGAAIGFGKGPADSVELWAGSPHSKI